MLLSPTPPKSSDRVRPRPAAFDTPHAVAQGRDLPSGHARQILGCSPACLGGLHGAMFCSQRPPSIDTVPSPAPKPLWTLCPGSTSPALQSHGKHQDVSLCSPAVQGPGPASASQLTGGKTPLDTRQGYSPAGKIRALREPALAPARDPPNQMTQDLGGKEMRRSQCRPPLDPYTPAPQPSYLPTGWTHKRTTTQVCQPSGPYTIIQAPFTSADASRTQDTYTLFAPSQLCPSLLRQRPAPQHGHGNPDPTQRCQGRKNAWRFPSIRFFCPKFG